MEIEVLDPTHEGPLPGSWPLEWYSAYGLMVSLIWLYLMLLRLLAILGRR